MINGMPEMNIVSMHPISNGDEAGAMGGVVSQIVMGPCRCTLPSQLVFVGGTPVWRLTATTLHNLANCPGTTMVPSQTIKDGPAVGRRAPHVPSAQRTGMVRLRASESATR